MNANRISEEELEGGFKISNPQQVESRIAAAVAENTRRLTQEINYWFEKWREAVEEGKRAVAAEREACVQAVESSRFHAGLPCGCGECAGAFLAIESIRARGDKPE